EGYADMEYSLLQELGLPHVPVVTTVHPAQIVPDIAVDAHDLPVDYIITPTETIATHTQLPKPNRIAWELLEPGDLQAMPVLQELRELKWQELSTRDVLAPGLDVLFVGINPGRKSAASGHNFAGPGNHFWRLLHEADFTPRRLAPQEEDELLQYGVGLTNLVSRASRGEHHLTREELVKGSAGRRAAPPASGRGIARETRVPRLRWLKPVRGRGMGHPAHVGRRRRPRLRRPEPVGPQHRSLRHASHPVPPAVEPVTAVQLKQRRLVIGCRVAK